MKKLFLILLLIPALVTAQDFRHRYFHYDQYYDDPDHTFDIMASTIDGTDNKQIQIIGGGDDAVTRGAFITVRGNEWGGASGDIDLIAGNVATGSIDFFTGGYSKITIPYVADADNVNLILGKSSTTAPLIDIRPQTIDTDDDASLCLSAGGADCSAAYHNQTRGAALVLTGEQEAQSGSLFLSTGGTGGAYFQLAASAANFYFRYGSSTSGQAFAVKGDGTGALFGPSAAATKVWSLYSARDTDGTDDDTLQLTAGGSSTMSGGRGAYIQLEGADVGGTAGYGGDINIVSGIGAEAVAGHYPTITIKAGTDDGSDWGITAISGGGSTASSTGAQVHLYGNEATVGGALRLHGGDVGATADIELKTNHASADIFFQNPTGTEWWIDSTNGNLEQYTQGGNIVFTRDGYGVIDSTEPTNAAGADLAGATLITANVTFVASVGAGEGVKFPTTPIGGQRFVIWNTENADLKIYPGEAGDQINAAGAGTAITVAAYTGCYCHAASASQIYCGEMATP